MLDFRPEFDSPSLFCRLLDSEKGGHFSICPPKDVQFTTKQQYLPSTNILQTRYIHDEGVVDLIDFFPRPKNSNVLAKVPSKQTPYREAITVQDELKKWLVRRVECIRGEMDIGMRYSYCVLSSYFEVKLSSTLQMSRSSQHLTMPEPRT